MPNQAIFFFCKYEYVRKMEKTIAELTLWTQDNESIFNNKLSPNCRNKKFIIQILSYKKVCN